MTIQVRLPGVTTPPPATRLDVQLGRFAHCPWREKSIVPIFTEDAADGMTAAKYKEFLQTEYQLDAKGAGFFYQTWLQNPPIRVRDLRMRPDRSKPIYTEDGERFVNLYNPPEHPVGDGDVEVFLRFIAHLIPNPDERSWFAQWLAHKFQKPHVRGVAVLFVAHKVAGAGRGTLFKLLARLFGRKYVEEIAFDTITGEGAQAHWTSWMAEALIVCVGESSSKAGKGRFVKDRNAYEYIKEIVDTTKETAEIRRKYAPNYSGPVFYSTIVASNNKTAIALPEEDRRFTVIANGPAMTDAMRDEMKAVIDDPVAVGSIARWLAAMDVSDFDVFRPIETLAKAEMIESHVDGLEQAVAEVIRDGLVGRCFSPEQVQTAIMFNVGKYGWRLSERWQEGVRNVVRDSAHLVLGGNDRPEHKGRKVTVYARTAQDATHWRSVPRANVRAELEKSDPPPLVPTAA